MAIVLGPGTAVQTPPALTAWVGFDQSKMMTWRVTSPRFIAS